MILVGTSGYSYSDWRGTFYPAQLSERDFLQFYAQNFRVCEINFTYYRMPDKLIFSRMQTKVGKDFEFIVKAHQSITHSRDADSRVILEFGRALEPLRKNNSLGCILLQFPYSFRPEKSAFEYLQRLRNEFADFPLVAEFRKREWLRERVFAFLREIGIGFCNVDEPPLRGLMPPTDRATSNIGYFRFHGRNKEKWWEHENAAERYDYFYSREELEEWVPRIRKVEKETEKTYVITNNHFQAKAIKNAFMLKDLLEVE